MPARKINFMTGLAPILLLSVVTACQSPSPSSISESVRILDDMAVQDDIPGGGEAIWWSGPACYGWHGGYGLKLQTPAISQSPASMTLVGGEEILSVPMNDQIINH